MTSSVGSRALTVTTSKMHLQFPEDVLLVAPTYTDLEVYKKKRGGDPERYARHDRKILKSQRGIISAKSMGRWSTPRPVIADACRRVGTALLDVGMDD